MESSDTTADGRAVLVQFFAAMEGGDIDAARSLLHEDLVMEWPQSGERFRGPDNAIAAMAATETKPEPVDEPRIVGGGSTWVLSMPLSYGGEIHHYVGVFEIVDGTIHRSTEYFGAPFPAQAGRSQYAEPPAAE